MTRTPFRTVLVAAATGLLLAGCTAPATPPRTPKASGRTVAAPAPTTPASPSTRTPTATVRADEVPGDKGDLGGVTLLHEGVEATDDESAWTAEPWRPGGCPTDGLRRAMGSVVAARVIGMSGPEIGFVEGLLRFPSEEEASAFVHEMAASHAKGCVTTEADDGSNRNLHNSAPLAAGDEGLAVASWIEVRNEGVWTEAPGGELLLVARKGVHVALSGYGGESVGDSSRPNTDVRREWHAELRKAIDHALDQV